MTYSYGETLLKIEGVCLDYEGRSILKNVNAEVRNIIVPGDTKGQVVGFLGPSGIGKTQLFRIIAGLNKPTKGKVILNGGKEKETNPGDVGVVAQNYPLFEHRTVESNLMLAARRKEPDLKKAQQKCFELAREFDLLDRIRAYPSQLSGGQRQRCAILQQILCSEHFLLMDEPFSGLDLLMLEKTQRLISKIAGMHELNTIIVITHDVTAAVAVADHLWLMGRDTDPISGKKVPGARIVKEYDLLARGLAWQPGITTAPELTAFVRELKEEFRCL